MPTYQYSCTECDHFFEQFQSFSEDSLTVCPECEGRLRKVFNAVGVVFKGSGFYRTDSRAANGSPTAGSGSGSNDGSSGEKASSGGSTEKASGGSTEKASSGSSSTSSAGTVAAGSAA